MKLLGSCEDPRSTTEQEEAAVRWKRQESDGRKPWRTKVGCYGDTEEGRGGANCVTLRSD